MPRKGFSLIELMIVIAIIVALMGLLMPILSSARRQAKKGTNISNLHQLGLAAELYGQTTDRSAISPLDFKNLPEWNSPVWASPFDSHKDGFRNNYLEYLVADKHSQYADRIVPFRVSYLAFADLFSRRTDFEKISARENAGWLVDFGESVGTDPVDPVTVLTRPYTRLNFDTSTTHHDGVPINVEFALIWLFCDPTPEQKAGDVK